MLRNGARRAHNEDPTSANFRRERGAAIQIWMIWVLTTINTGLVAGLVFYIASRDAVADKQTESVKEIHRALDRLGVPP